MNIMTPSLPVLASPPPPAGLLVGQVMHRRLRPFAHRLQYHVFSLWLDLDRLTQAQTRLLHINRGGLFSFHEADHGPRDGSSLAGWVRRALQQAGLEQYGAQLRVQCFPRVLGYVFNPLSVYFCYDADHRLGAILYEVNNTFGDRHSYLLPVPPDTAPGAPVVHDCAKVFHVSPFNAMDMHYRFRVKPPGPTLSVLIRTFDAGGELLVAAHTARLVALTDKTLARLAVTQPLLTYKVMAGIHWEALKLWVKGAKYHPRPPAPSHEITHTP